MRGLIEGEYNVKHNRNRNEGFYNAAPRRDVSEALDVEDSKILCKRVDMFNILFLVQ